MLTRIEKAFCLLFFAGLFSGIADIRAQGPVRQIGSRLELFVDDYLIKHMDGVELKLHTPIPAEVALRFDKPWEGAFSAYVTVLQDGAKFRMYYRGMPVSGADGSAAEVTCYAESEDGINWNKPDLAVYEVNGSLKNNVILKDQAPFTHNFSPFVDARPGVPQSERFKALAGTSKTGLVAFVSEDGIHWQRWRDKALLTDGAFDSQNVAFWSPAESCYVCYYRTWTEGGYKGIRTISRATSKDFVEWTPRQQMDFGDTPLEHLYTNQTTPYFRAPHLYIALPMRFMPGRQVLTEEQAKVLGVDPKYRGDCAEAVFMTSRGGNRYARTFMEGFIRPGNDAGNWASRDGLTALGILPTGANEMSIYKQEHYAQASNQLRRYVLRTDGFVSANAPYRGGTMTTKPIVFAGSKLVINFSTSAAGFIKIEILDQDGIPIPGYGLEQSQEIIGDEIERVVQWNSTTDLKKLAGQPVRLRFTMKDADLFSIRFTE